MVADAYRRTEDLLKEHRGALEDMAKALLEKETLNQVGNPVRAQGRWRLGAQSTTLKKTSSNTYTLAV